jgi:hypothetical protein
MTTLYLDLLAAGLGVMSVGLFLRTRSQQAYIKRLVAKTEYDKRWLTENIASNIKHQTGFKDADSLITAWRSLRHDFGYALHHIEEFEPTTTLKKQLGMMGSCLRLGARRSLTFRKGELGGGGFREVGTSEDEIGLLCDGMTDEQLAHVCCHILDGYYLEGAFSEVGITVLSPAGKAMVLGKEPINPYGATVPAARRGLLVSNA